MSLLLGMNGLSSMNAGTSAYPSTGDIPSAMLCFITGFRPLHPQQPTFMDKAWECLKLTQAAL